MSDPKTDKDNQTKPDGGSETKPKAKAKENPAPTALVWTARILSLGALLSIVGYLFFMIATDNRPAQFEIRPDFDALREQGGRYVLPVSVINDSTDAVTAVVVDAVLDAGGEPEEISLTLPLMGEGETARVEIVFDARPTPDTLDIDVSSYQSP